MAQTPRPKQFIKENNQSINELKVKIASGFSPTCVHVCVYLGSIDESPCIEQTEAVLVAVVETGSVHLPVCTAVTLLKQIYR